MGISAGAVAGTPVSAVPQFVVVGTPGNTGDALIVFRMA